MSNVNFEKHYAAFKWAVSREWKDKNGLHRSIQYKIETLVQEYNLFEREILDELFFDYWQRGHFQKFDEAKGSLNNWIAHYANLYLKHLLRRCAIRSKDDPCNKIDPLDRRNWANLDWVDEENTGDDPDYQPEILFDPTKPEDLLIAKGDPKIRLRPFQTDRDCLPERRDRPARGSRKIGAELGCLQEKTGKMEKTFQKRHHGIRAQCSLNPAKTLMF